MSTMSNFNASVLVSNKMSEMMSSIAQELAIRSVMECGVMYKFDSSEAIRLLGLSNVTVMSSSSSKSVEKKVAKVSAKKVSIKVAKPAFPLPYNGEFAADCCCGLRQNNGLYTQCQSAPVSEGSFCKQCQISADQNDGIPEYGTIQQRQSADIFDYTDPKGRKPTSYTKVMKKFKLTSEQVLEEAAKFSIKINNNHLTILESESGKRGRPTVAKEPKEAKGPKGRPKKGKKVINFEVDDDDLFATLVADANNSSDDEVVPGVAPEVLAEVVSEVVPKKKTKKSENLAEGLDKEQKAKEAKEAKEAEKLAIKEAAKLAAEAEKLALKEAKEQKAKEEKEAKEAAKQAIETEKAAKVQAKLDKEAKLAADKLAKEAEKAAKEAEKVAKEAEKVAKAQAKTETKPAAKVAAKPAAKPAAKVVAASDEADVVKKIEVDGVKYLKSKQTGIVYDYRKYIDAGEQLVVGKWNDATSKIVFNNNADSDEESEEEYDN